MKLVKIGASFINLDTVREIRESDSSLTVIFLDGHERQIQGIEMEAFQRWLTAHADLILDRPHHQGSPRPSH
jgi:hypothetical protein